MSAAPAAAAPLCCRCLASYMDQSILCHLIVPPSKPYEPSLHTMSHGRVRALLLLLRLPLLTFFKLSTRINITSSQCAPLFQNDE